jgi:hypothetical protein
MMKRILIFIALAGAMALSSCATKAHCDAYGSSGDYVENDSTKSV